jgi:hypothetical protein
MLEDIADGVPTAGSESFPSFLHEIAPPRP